MKPTHAEQCRLPGCRKGRPRCAYHRQQNRHWAVCQCPGYHFPHRLGSGACVQGKDADRKAWERNTKTSWYDGTPL